MAASATKSRLSVSAVVLTHDHWRHSELCLHSLLRATGVDEIIVVDNGSRDETPQRLRQLAASERAGGRLRCLFNSENRGGSAARNDGAVLASRELLVFFDNDAFALESRWLQRMASRLLSSTDVGAVGPLALYPGVDEFVQSAGGGATAQGEFGLLGRGLPAASPTLLRARPVAWVPSSCMLLRRETFLAVGGFDIGFDPVSIGEDIDLCMKLRAQSLHVWYEPSACIRHFEGSTFDDATLRPLKLAAFLTNMRTIRRRWLPLLREGPLATPEEVRYLYIRKNYRDLQHPRVDVIPGFVDSFAEPGRIRPHRATAAVGEAGTAPVLL